MLKEAVDFAKQLFSLTRDVQQNKADVKELRDDVRELRQEFSKFDACGGASCSGVAARPSKRTA